MGDPFYIQGDAGWLVLVQLDSDEVLHYARSRSEQGFNTVLVNLIDARFSDNPPSDAAGNVPFAAGREFASPNDDYFDRAHELLRLLAGEGLFILLVPAYIGYEGTDQGWSESLERASEEGCSGYGSFVADRFSDIENIAWVAGGDASPEPGGRIERCMLSMFEAIRATSPGALITGHWGPETDSLTPAAFRHLMDFNGVYTYRSVWEACRDASTRRRVPTFLLETKYEGEWGVTSEEMRQRIYEAALGCPAGQIFGTGDVWRFPVQWDASLATPGALAMEIAGSTLRSLRWWEAEVRTTAGVKTLTGTDLDGTPLDLIYLPTSEPGTSVPGSPATQLLTLWIDPANGQQELRSVQLPPGEEFQLAPPGPNSSGSRDWLLILKTSW